MPILKLPQWCSIHPIRFSRPSNANDTPEAWAKLERDYQQFLRELREAVWCFGAARVQQDVHDIIKGQQGNTPDEERNARILAKWYSVPGNKSKTAREYVKDHPEETFEAVYRQLGRLLKAQERKSRKKAEFDQNMRNGGPSVAGSGTK